MRDFDVADPGEDEFYGIDFVNDMPSTGGVADTISAATVTLIVKIGPDPSPSSHLIGSYIILDGPGGNPTVVAQRIRGLLAGNIYTLQIVVVTSGGSNVSLWANIPCEPVY